MNRIQSLDTSITRRYTQFTRNQVDQGTHVSCISTWVVRDVTHGSNVCIFGYTRVRGDPLEFLGTCARSASGLTPSRCYIRSKLALFEVRRPEASRSWLQGVVAMVCS